MERELQDNLIRIVFDLDVGSRPVDRPLKLGVHQVLSHGLGERPCLISITKVLPLGVSELGADTDPFTLHLYAALAEKNRALISRKTKDALAAAKACWSEAG
jgi:hypothetical protein